MLTEKQVPFERRDIDLAAKPEWFLALSPQGQTPVLVTEGHALFESAVICEYLDETLAPVLLPADPLARARQRGWIAFASTLLDATGRLYSAADEAALHDATRVVRRRLEQLNAALGDGPYFDSGSFGLVDAALAPAFRYYDLFDAVLGPGLWAGLTRLARYRAALRERPSVAAVVVPDYALRLRRFVEAKRSAMGQRLEEMRATGATAP